MARPSAKATYTRMDEMTAEDFAILQSYKYNIRPARAGVPLLMRKTGRTARADRRCDGSWLCLPGMESAKYEEENEQAIRNDLVEKIVERDKEAG